MCSICKHHYDYQCSGVTEAGFRRLGERKNSWRCPKCKSSTLSSPAATSPQPCQEGLIQEQLQKIMLQLAPLASLVADVKSIKEEMSSIKESLNMAHELINNFSDKVYKLESKVIQVEKTTNEIPVLRAEINKLYRELQDRDQWNRANNIEIRGVPQKNNENLYGVVQDVAGLCDFPFRKEDVNYIARTPTRVPNADKPILVSLHNRYAKEEFVALARKSEKMNTSNLGFSVANNVYVNDHLTQSNKTLLGKAKRLAKENNFRYIWVKHCKIMARKSDTSPIFFIKCEKDLEKIK